MSCRAYMTWRIDCDCGHVEDLADGEDPPEHCPACGADIETS